MFWQPMISAPKDGSPILAWCKHTPATENTPTAYDIQAEYKHTTDGVHIIVWMEGGYIIDFETDDYNYLPDWWFLDKEYSEESSAANPLLWMPLPEPPTEVSK